MVIVGLTGGIGSGKSTVSELFAAKGAVIVDADQIAREVVRPGSPVLERLADEFGSDIVDASGVLNRRLLAYRAFSSPEAATRLNAITHPAISRRIAELSKEAADDGADVVVHDSPLLIEQGAQDTVDVVVVVDAPVAIRRHRLVELRGLAPTDVDARMSRQATDEERRAAADIIIDNSGTMEALRRQVDDVWGQLHLSG